MKKQELEKFNMLYTKRNSRARERERERERESKPAFPKIGIVFVLLLLVFNLSYPQVASATIF
ncbi:MAG: hypothetical protein A3I97_03055 [Candidatus Taylorbacteria bacterium RIFCSPLOWO2_02_FULL_44_35]|nr:MAG: hypothetical protein A3I97_03055 [Candidatus Taylorbacteria bacterium RIFCSPLOWO2_02_FULL_44_35]